jgi:tyrosinase
MAVTRPNILANNQALQQYCDGVKKLKNEFTGPTTDSFGIDGPPQQVSTYDLFVVWHVIAMMTLTPPNQSQRNAAHSGPVFMPWHRFMLRQLELNLQRVLANQDFGLPYWDWAADGQLPPGQQPQAQLWSAAGIGGTGSPITTGPFVFDPADPQSFAVLVETDSNGDLRQANRGLNRTLGQEPQAPALPDKTATAQAIATTPYDAAPWNRSSNSFRNRTEGWLPYGMHNKVHVWVGGDMLPAASPNDPVFFLNHCNIDRIWEAWMTQHGRTYLPDQSEPDSLMGHRLNDQLSSLISASTTPADVLDSTQQYVYDSLAV